MEENNVFAIVRRAETSYIRGQNVIGKYVTFSMHEVLETIDAYLNSKHISGPTDSLRRDKPFFNIVTAARNIWFRATDINRRDLKFIPTQSSSVVLAMLANIFLQRWMDENNFGQWLNKWGISLASYGSSVPKFVEQNGKLRCSITPWNRLIPDPIDFDALPTIEKIYKTPAQLRRMATPGDPAYVGFDQDQVEAFLTAYVVRKTLDQQSKDDKSYFVELYEVHGELPVAMLAKNPADIDKQDKRWKTYRQQMHVIGYVARADKENEYDDFAFYKGKEAKHPYKLTTLLEQDGRTLGIGSVEFLFDAQWMANHTIKNMKDTLDLASKLIFQTADANFAGRNALSAIETGDILITAENKPITRVANDNPSVAAYSGFLQLWENMAQELTATPEAMRGGAPKSGTAYRLQALTLQQSMNLFDLMHQNKALALEEIMREYIIPYIKKQLKNKDEIVALLDDAGIAEIDSVYIPREAVRRYNERTSKQLFDNIETIAQGGIPPPLPRFNPAQEQAGVKNDLGALGNRRFFKPDDIDKKTWADLFSDFEWENIRIDIPGENIDKQAILQTLSTVLQTIAQNPTILQDENAKMLFGKILQETNVISPLQIKAAQIQPMNGPQGPMNIPLGAAPTNVLPQRSRAAPEIG